MKLYLFYKNSHVESNEGGKDRIGTVGSCHFRVILLLFWRDVQELLDVLNSFVHPDLRNLGMVPNTTLHDMMVIVFVFLWCDPLVYICRIDEQ